MTARTGLRGFKRALLAMALVFPTGSLALADDGVSPTPVMVRDAVAAVGKADCKTALQLVPPDPAMIEALSGELRSTATDVVVMCLINMERHADAYGFALRGTRRTDASDRLWRTRLALELDAQRRDAALTSVLEMAQGRNMALAAVPVRWLYQLDRMLRDSGDVAGRRRLLSILVAPTYRPDEPLPVIDVFRKRYAELLFDEGEKTQAMRLVARIDTPGLMLALSVDPRFRAAIPETWDARAAMHAYLARLREIAVSRPNVLGLVVEMASIQRYLGDPDAALTTLRVADPTAPNVRYVDEDEKRNWWWDEIARSQAAAGRYAQAIDAFREGIATQENGGRNVSQTINLAYAQLRQGHPADALATLAVFDREPLNASPYGIMEMRLARGCATKLTGGDPTADVAFARAHAVDHPSALGDLLLCVGDMPGAAAAFVARLDDPARRADALLELGDYDPPSAAVPVDPIHGRLPALKARAEVGAAIGRAGGTRRFAIQRPDL